jgi:xanthine dehydrogenase molybdopterin-binding subunit B
LLVKILALWYSLLNHLNSISEKGTQRFEKLFELQLCCLALIQIAETQKYAYMAAKQAVIEYSTENLEPPILTIEDAIQRNSYFHPPPFLVPRPVGDFDKGMSEADHKILSGEVHTSFQDAKVSFSQAPIYI